MRQTIAILLVLTASMAVGGCIQKMALQELDEDIPDDVLSQFSKEPGLVDEGYGDFPLHILPLWSLQKGQVIRNKDNSFYATERIDLLPFEIAGFGQTAYFNDSGKRLQSTSGGGFAWDLMMHGFMSKDYAPTGEILRETGDVSLFVILIRSYSEKVNDEGGTPLRDHAHISFLGSLLLFSGTSTDSYEEVSAEFAWGLLGLSKVEGHRTLKLFFIPIPL